MYDRSGWMDGWMSTLFKSLQRKIMGKLLRLTNPRFWKIGRGGKALRKRGKQITNWKYTLFYHTIKEHKFLKHKRHFTDFEWKLKNDKLGRRSLLAREGEDNEVAEENFWDEMDKMCRKGNINMFFFNALSCNFFKDLMNLNKPKISGM